MQVTIKQPSYKIKLLKNVTKVPNRLTLNF